MRHLDVSQLWIQERLKNKSFGLRKVLGTDNPSDALTKYLSRPELVKHLACMHVVYEEGRAALAPALPPA